MNNISWILIFGLFFGFFSCKEQKEQKIAAPVEDNGTPLDVDIDSSVIYWTGFSPKAEHHGTLKLKEGILYISDGKIKLGGFTIDMNTIRCTSILNEKDNQKLETHLKRGDFFDVVRFPEAQFTINNVEEINDQDSISHRISGTLELKGLEQGVSFDAKITKEGDIYKGVTRPFRIDRTRWGINYGSNTVYDAMQTSIVEDYIELKVVIVARDRDTK